MRSTLLLLAATLVLAACGDARTNDSRGYTKAPLEQPGVIVDQEPTSAMEGIGTTNRPRPQIVQVPLDTAAMAANSAGSAGQVAGGGQAAGQQPVKLAAGVTQAQYDEGEKIFKGQGNCYTCHGPDAHGTQLAPNLTDSEWLHVSGPNVDELAKLITNGVPNPVSHPAPMPAMGGATLTPEQVQAVAGYVASLSQK